MDAVVNDTVAALFRLIFDMATVLDVIEEEGLDVNVFGREELVVDVTSTKPTNIEATIRVQARV